MKIDAHQHFWRYNTAGIRSEARLASRGSPEEPTVAWVRRGHRCAGPSVAARIPVATGVAGSAADLEHAQSGSDPSLMKGTTGEGADQKFQLLQSLELSVGMTEPVVGWSHSLEVVSHGARGEARHATG